MLTKEHQLFLKEYYDADINEYDWTFEPLFPISDIQSSSFKSKDEWLNWLTFEESLVVGEDRDNNYYYLGASYNYPIIIVNNEVIDGNHRVAISIRNNHVYIPAIVGFLKLNET